MEVPDYDIIVANEKIKPMWLAQNVKHLNWVIASNYKIYRVKIHIFIR